MTDLTYTPLSGRRVLKISGEESKSFLQGLVSNDMERVSESAAIYAALLTPQGKYLHDFFIAEHAGNLYLDCEAERIDDLFKRLRMFKMRAKIELEIIEGLGVAALYGTGAIELPKNAADNIFFADPRCTAIGARALLPVDQLEKKLEDLGFTQRPNEAYESLRLSLGLPDSSRDLEIDKSILLESGFEELNGVDFNKGCYIGQELTARTKHRGLIKKRLIPVKIDGTPPTPGTEITQDGKNAGELRSSIAPDGQAIGLALLRLEALENSAPLTADGVTLIPQKPDWANF